MKTIIGSAIGVAAVGLILVGVGLRGTASNAPVAQPPVYAASPSTPAPIPVADTITRTAAGGPVMVNCAPGQRALVRQVSLNGEAVSQVACVADPAAFATDGGSVAPIARPVSYRTPRTSRVAERRVVYQEQASRQVVQPKRSWKKDLLVIGGSTAAGAGIGGLVGGKKGALIGAALGGGASTIYEATKR